MATPTPVTTNGASAESKFGQQEMQSGESPMLRRRTPLWVKVFPFFTSAIFFMSGIFAIFAPIPLVILNLRAGRLLGWLVVLTNLGLVYFAGGSASLAIYGIFVAVLSVVLAEFLRARKSIDFSAGMTLVFMTLMAGLMIFWFSHVHQVNPWMEAKREISAAVDLLVKNAPPGSLSSAGTDVGDWKQGLITEFPSAIAVFALVMVWTSLVAVLRFNPSGIVQKLGLDSNYANRWRSPEWLVWPTIAAGFFLVVDAGPVSDVAQNIFKFLMAVYTIHGLSILSFFFDLWSVRGPFRAVGYLISIFVMMPLLLSLGFFDLWFNFRAKFQQR